MFQMISSVYMRNSSSVASVTPLPADRKTKDIEIDDDVNDNPQLSLIGFSRLTNPSYRLYRKIIWIIILSVVFYYCYCQLSTCIKTFYNYDVIKDASTVRSTTIKFPTIFLCPGFTRTLFFTMTRMAAHNWSCTDPDTKACENDIRYSELYQNLKKDFQSNASVDKLWMTKAATMKDEIKLYSPCSNVMSPNCTEDGELLPLKMIQVPSFWGGCLGFECESELDYRGPLTYLKLVYNTNASNYFKGLIQRDSYIRSKTNPENHEPGLLLYICDNCTKDTRHEIFYFTQEILQGYLVHVEFKLQKFKLLNVPSDPCSEEGNYTQCTSNCLDHFLSKKVSCRLPYVKSSHPKCTSAELLHTHLINYNSYLAFDESKNCNCPPNCIENRYTFSQDVIDKLSDSNLVHIKMFFADSNYDQTVARLAYDFSVLLSDIGGTLGFFIGFCTLSLVEFVEFFLVWFFKHLFCNPRSNKSNSRGHVISGNMNRRLESANIKE